MHEKGQMSWTKENTPLTFPCFVVWRNRPDGTRKGRVVIDIRAFNATTEADAYPMPTQDDIIAELQGAYRASHPLK